MKQLCRLLCFLLIPGAYLLGLQDLNLSRPVRPPRQAEATPPQSPPTLPFQVVDTPPGGGIQGQPFAFTFASLNGFAPMNWTIASGSLPPGLTLRASAGEVSGIPSAPGTYGFTLQVVDGFGRLATRVFLMIISSSSASYGNTPGDAYATEGGAPNPAAIILNACQTTALTSNTSYRLGQSVTVPAGTTGQNCFLLSNGVKLDLAGFTITGRLNRNGNANGISVFNGTINCNWADNGADAGCVRITSTSAVAVPMRLHHLTITNTGVLSRSMHIEWGVTSKFAGGASVQVYNITAFVPAQPLVSRSFALSLIGTNQTPEFFNNDLTCAADAAACQGIMCYGAGDCKIHHNRVNMILNTTGLGGRGLLVDGGAAAGEVWNNLVIANNQRALRVRDSFNIRIHHNRILNIMNNDAAVIHLGDPDAGAVNDLRVLIDENDFELADGKVIFIRNGFNVTARNNRFSCVGNCSLSKFAIVRTPLSPGTRSELTLENNPNVILYMAPPQNQVDPGGTLSICNSGQAGGSGTIIPTACVP